VLAVAAAALIAGAAMADAAPEPLRPPLPPPQEADGHVLRLEPPT
jgi:hypothetical protein